MSSPATNIKHLKERLHDKRRDLLSVITCLEVEGRVSSEAEVRDSTGDATSFQSTSESFEEDTLASRTLIEVQDALRRFEDGAYGKCVACGARLRPPAWKQFPGRHIAWRIRRNRK